jgi:membrane-bound serine protease (ClpP class)
MLIAVLLGFVGLLFIYLEFYLPGGIMAVIGAMIGFAGVLLALNCSYTAGIIYALFEIALVAFVIKMAIRGVQKNGLCLTSDQAGYTSSSFDASLVGMDGEVIMDLKPSGYVLVKGIRCQALSDGEYLKKGTRIKVIDGEGAHLIVRS